MYIKKFINLLQEVINLIVKFFTPIEVKEKVFELPKNIRKMGYKLGAMNLVMTVIGLIFAFLLKISNLMIEARLILLGIILFMLYRGQQVVREAYTLFHDSEASKFDLIFSDELVYRGAQIIGKVSDKVLKFDKTNNIYRIMTNEEVINSIKNYLGTLWRIQLKHKFEVLELFSVVIMLVFAIVTNTGIPQKIFIPLLTFFIIIIFFRTAYICTKRVDYYNRNREYNNKQDILINDLLRVPSIVKKDLDMRINRFQETTRESNENIKKFHKKMNVSSLITTFIEAFSQYGIIIFSILSINWESINLATITEITATLLIVETALGHIRGIARSFNGHSEKMTTLEEETEDISLILDVYHKEEKKTSIKEDEVERIILKPFEIKYNEESENDRPFTLVSENSIIIPKGDVVILSGPSGSGKSTFMKLITERIKVEKNIDIPSTSRYTFYDEKMVFGSLTLFEELFCGEENPNLKKMQDILEHLHLWQEISSNCIDVWKWMKEKKFNNSLSNGQKQRLVLAKMLYWLDDTIDVVVLDECTSGLDDKSEEDSADAERILEYIINYCNEDKQRIVVISTHQNILSVQQKLIKDGFTFQNLRFKKQGERNLIKKI